MARPPLRPEERRDDRLPNLRVTAAERVLIEERAAAAGLIVAANTKAELKNIRTRFIIIGFIGLMVSPFFGSE